MEYTCLYCDKLFYKNSKRIYKYCSNECYTLARGGVIGGQVEITCVYCGKKKLVDHAEYTRGNHRFCSKECVDTSKRQDIHKVCDYCKKEFIVRARLKEQRFCSKRCSNEGIKKLPRYHNCEYCGIKFDLRYDLEKRFCSVKCSAIFTRKRVWRYKTCPYCSKEFNAHEDRIIYCSRRCAASNKLPTSLEIQLYNYLDSINIEYEKQKQIGRIVPDAFIPSLKLAIYADGTYWHSSPDRRLQDSRGIRYLLDGGYNVVRLLEKKKMLELDSLDVYLNNFE